MNKKRKLFILGLFIVSLLVVGYIELISLHKNKSQEKILKLRTTNSKKFAKALEYLVNNPIKSLLYIIAELNNEQKIPESWNLRDTIIEYKEPFRNYFRPYFCGAYFWDENIPGINTILLNVLEKRDIEQKLTFFSKRAQIQEWQKWYSENYPYLYQDRWWFETNLLAKRCKINMQRWMNMPDKRKEELSQKVYSQEDEKCLKANINVKPPNKEMSGIINEVASIANNYFREYPTDYSHYSREIESKYYQYLSDCEEMSQKGNKINDFIPSLIYAYNRNFDIGFRLTVVSIIAKINNDLAEKALLMIVDDIDERVVVRSWAISDYIDIKKENWQEKVSVYLSAQIDEGRLWKELEFKLKRAKDVSIPILIKALNTSDTEKRRWIAYQIFYIIDHFIAIDKNDNDFYTISIKRLRSGFGPWSSECILDVPPEQLAKIIEKLEQWWKENQR